MLRFLTKRNGKTNEARITNHLQEVNSERSLIELQARHCEWFSFTRQNSGNYQWVVL